MPCVGIILNEIECRVLGALVEKETATPEYYPLSLNALVNACNQKSNRHPVMDLYEDAVRGAIESLNEKKLAGAIARADSRVTKYEHRLQEVFNFSRPEIAVLCVLLLRGPQTPGELRGRTERLHQFHDLDEVHSALDHLMKREPPLATILPRQPGTKESRYAHLLCGEVENAVSPAAEVSRVVANGPTHLHEELAELRAELARLRGEFEDFKKRFE